MTIQYNLTGADRKALVSAVSSITGCEAKYLGAPSFAYQVGHLIIDRAGGVTFDDDTDAGSLVDQLVGMGFKAEPDGQDSITTEQAAPHDGLVIQMPRAGFPQEALNNLHALIAAKGRLISKALGVDSLPIQVEEDTLSFPWFSGEASGEEVKAYTHLVTALCDMARNQKRIIAKERDTGNDKYAFRCFLLRLGFIGTEYKEERKILLRNLTGSSAFKSGSKPM